MTIRPCYLHFDSDTKDLIKIEGKGFWFNVEVAGLGEMSSSDFCNKLKGDLYLGKNDALLHNSNKVYRTYQFADAELYMYFADINLGDLNIDNPYTTFEYKYGERYCHNDLILKPVSYYWTGTCAEKREINWKFRINLIDNCVDIFHDEYEDKLGTLYATKPMCEEANKPTIVTFDKKSGKTAKLVTFELTTRVVIDDDCDDDCAIEEAIRKFKRGETNGICYDTCVDVQDDVECPYED